MSSVKFDISRQQQLFGALMSNIVFQDEAEMAQRKIEEEFRELSKTLEDAKEKVRVIDSVVPIVQKFSE